MLKKIVNKKSPSIQILLSVSQVVLACSILPSASADPTPYIHAATVNQAVPMVNQPAPTIGSEAILNARFPLAGLSLVTEPNLKRLADNEGEIEIGQVSALEASQFEQTFQLKNTSKTPLTVGRLQPSCHCTSAIFETTKGKKDQNHTEDGSYSLPPGQTATVRVHINLAQLGAGPIVKSVFVYLKGNTQPAALVTFSGQLRPNLTLWPKQIDFGQVQLGSPRSLTVTATFDPRLAPGGTLPALASSDPDVQVVPAPDEAASPGGGTVSQTQEPGMLRRTYTISLSPTSAGPVAATLSFAPSVPAAKTATALPLSREAKPDPAAILASVSIPVQGEVVGDVAAEPASLALGPVPGQHEATGQVALTAQEEEDLSGATVTSPSPYVSGKLQAVQPMLGGGGGTGTPPGGKILEITIGPKAPLGHLQTSVIVTLANGHRLHVPVSAYIIAPTAL